MTTEFPGDDNDSSDRQNVRTEFTDLDEFSHVVAEAVAQSRGDDVFEITPLDEDVDLEAIQKALLSDAPMLVRFSVQDTTVFVNKNGVVAAPTEETALEKRA